MSRLSGLVKKKIGGEDPEDTMTDVIGVLTESQDTPEVGGYYTFIYNPKTPNIRYDAHPLVAVTAVFPWGFKGFNVHWNGYRQYTYEEIIGGTYRLLDDKEFEDAKKLSYGLQKTA